MSFRFQLSSRGSTYWNFITVHFERPRTHYCNRYYEGSFNNAFNVISWHPLLSSGLRYILILWHPSCMPLSPLSFTLIISDTQVSSSTILNTDSILIDIMQFVCLHCWFFLNKLFSNFKLQTKCYKTKWYHTE